MSLTEQFNTLNNQNLRNRTKMAVLNASRDILNAENPEPNVLNFAKTAMREPQNDSWLNLAMYKIVLNPTIVAAGENATDNDIQFVVNSEFQNIAHDYFNAV